MASPVNWAALNPVADLGKCTVTELKTVLLENGVAIPNRAKKADLLDLLDDLIDERTPCVFRSKDEVAWREQDRGVSRGWNLSSAFKGTLLTLLVVLLAVVAYYALSKEANPAGIAKHLSQHLCERKGLAECGYNISTSGLPESELRELCGAACGDDRVFESVLGLLVESGSFPVSRSNGTLVCNEPVLPLWCRVRRYLLGVLERNVKVVVIVVALGLAMLYARFKVSRYYGSRKEARLMYEQVMWLLYEQQSSLSLVDVQNSVMTLSEKQAKSGLWARVVSMASSNPNIRQFPLKKFGEERECWQWISELPPNCDEPASRLSTGKRSRAGSWGEGVSVESPFGSAVKHLSFNNSQTSAYGVSPSTQPSPPAFSERASPPSFFAASGSPDKQATPPAKKPSPRKTAKFW